ncbi:DUF2092 domain-containing protein [Pannus brasiliensis CCIBt3594]|uniref:DUF2092 domain-containing protein n=1 Tax=Pannus brasiliensis CCIBt3594 TaxID=1427578 RepID=A0AAW9QNL4_9CHRO
MRRFLSIVSLGLPLVFPVVSATGLPAQTPPASAEKTAPRPRTAEQLLDEVCAVLKNARSFTVDMDITYDAVLDSGSKVQYSAYQQVWVQKPDRLRSDYIGDERATRFYYDGKTATLQDTNRNLYATKTAPNTLDGALNQVEEKYGITIPMSNLAAGDPCADIKANVSRMIFVGVDMVNRVPMYHLLLIGSDRDFQLWITREPRPLLKKAIITYKNLPGAPQYTAVLSNWNFNPKIPANTFTFTPPKGSIGIEFLPETGNETGDRSQ